MAKAGSPARFQFRATSGMIHHEITKEPLLYYTDVRSTDVCNFGNRKPTRWPIYEPIESLNRASPYSLRELSAVAITLRFIEGSSLSSLRFESRKRMAKILFVAILAIGRVFQ